MKSLIVVYMLPGLPGQERKVLLLPEQRVAADLPCLSFREAASTLCTTVTVPR